MKTILSDQLKSWRSSRNLSQRDAALVLGVNKRTLQGWEWGKPGPRGIGREALSRKLSRKNLALDELNVGKQTPEYTEKFLLKR